MSDKTKKTDTEKDESERPRHVPVKPDDPDLAEWIADLWADGDSPLEIKVMQVYQRGKVLGEAVHTESFKPNAKMDIEIAGTLANRLLGAAQRDCNSVVKKPQTYYVIALDEAKASDGYRRYPLDLYPKSVKVTPSKLVRGSTDEDDDEEITAQTLMLRYTEQMISAGQFDKEHYARVFGDVFLLFNNVITEERARTTQLMNQNIMLFQEMITALRERENARNMEVDREIAREEKKFWIDIKKDGYRAGRNILSSVFSGGGSKSLESSNGSKPAGRRSKESILIENFLADCESTGVSVKLFGDWEEVDGQLRQKSKGIFTPQQFAVLLQVRDGLAPPETVDNLMPGSNSEIAITPQQMSLAQPLMTEGTQLGLAGLYEQCQKRASERAKSQTPPVASPTT